MAEESNDLDLEKVQEYIKGQVETYAADAFKTYQQQMESTRQQQQQTQTTEQAAQAELQRTLDPFITPRINATQLAVSDINDKVDFTLNHPEFEDIREDVNKMFEGLKAQGRAIPRADIARFLLGKMATEDPEKFSKRQTERQKRQLDTATSATDFGYGALDKAKSDPVWSNVRNMPSTDLEKALDGVTF